MSYNGAGAQGTRIWKLIRSHSNWDSHMLDGRPHCREQTGEKTVVVWHFYWFYPPFTFFCTHFTPTVSASRLWIPFSCKLSGRGVYESARFQGGGGVWGRVPFAPNVLDCGTARSSTFATQQGNMELGAPPAVPTTKACTYCYSTIPIMATRCPSCTSELTPN
jgi:hypothetical protein